MLQLPPTEAGELRFHAFIPGKPAPKGSKTPNRGGFGMRESSVHLPAWNEALNKALEDQGPPEGPLDGPLKVDYLFVMPRLKSHYRANGELKDSAPYWHTVMPDKDKLERAVGDALTRNKVIKDDARIADSDRVRKVFGEEPGVYIWVWQLDDRRPAEDV